MTADSVAGDSETAILIEGIEDWLGDFDEWRPDIEAFLVPIIEMERKQEQTYERSVTNPPCNDALRWTVSEFYEIEGIDKEKSAIGKSLKKLADKDLLGRRRAGNPYEYWLAHSLEEIVEWSESTSESATNLSPDSSDSKRRPCPVPGPFSATELKAYAATLLVCGVITAVFAAHAQLPVSIFTLGVVAAMFSLVPFSIGQGFSSANRVLSHVDRFPLDA